MPATDRAFAVPAAAARPRWLWPLTLGLALAGFLVAAYLTVEHYTAATTLACPARGILNCEKVTTSVHSRVLGIPVALLGLGFFAAMLALTTPAAWRSRAGAVRTARLAGASVGVLFVLYLVYVELFVVDAICLWCTAVHALAVALFAAVTVGTAVTAEA